MTAGDGVQGPEGLVQQQDVRVQDEGASDRHPLAHASGELPRPGPLEPGHADQLQQMGNAVPVRAPAGHSVGKRDVVPGGQPRQQGVVLEGDTEAVLAGQVGGRATLDEDRARGRRL